MRYVFITMSSLLAKSARVTLILVAMLASLGTTQASITIYTDVTVGGFVANSAFDTPAFLAAIGTPDEFISFSQDKFGNPATSPTAVGTFFSDNVVFSSMASGTYGGINSALVNSTGSGLGSEIGPVGPGWDGVLNVDFLAAGQTASIVGFGPVLLGVLEVIRVYDQGNILVGSFAGLNDSETSFFGVEGTGGTEIGRVELEGDFFAIQDIQFDLADGQAVVPEASSAIVWALGAFVAALAIYCNRRYSTISRSQLFS